MWWCTPTTAPTRWDSARATGQCRDHDFEYRACTSTGEVVRLHDVVIVLRGLRGVAERLRGVMLPRPEAESSAG